MLRGQQQDQFIHIADKTHEPFERRILTDDRHFGRAGDDGPHRLLTQRFLEIDLDRRMPGEKTRQQLRQETGERGGIGPDAQTAARPATVIVERERQTFNLGDHSDRLVEERLAGRRRHDPLLAPHQQGHANMRLKIGDAFARRGDTDAESAGAGAQTAAI